MQIVTKKGILDRKILFSENKTVFEEGRVAKRSKALKQGNCKEQTLAKEGDTFSRKKC